MTLKSQHAKALTSPNVHVPLKSASHVHLPGRTCQFWLLMNQDKLARLVNQTLLQIAQIFYSRMFGMKSLYLFGTVQKVCLALMRGSINPISGSKTILLFGSRLLQQWWFALSVITIHGVFPLQVSRTQIQINEIWVYLSAISGKFWGRLFFEQIGTCTGHFVEINVTAAGKWKL